MFIVTEVGALRLHHRDGFRDALHNCFHLIRRRHRRIFHDRVVSLIRFGDASCDHKSGHVRAISDLYTDRLLFSVHQEKHLELFIEDLLLGFFLRCGLYQLDDRVVISHAALSDFFRIREICKYSLEFFCKSTFPGIYADHGALYRLEVDLALGRAHECDIKACHEKDRESQ